MFQHNNKTISPLMAAIIGVAIGAAATYIMRAEEREKIAKNYGAIKNRAQALIKTTKKKVDKTKADLKNWAEDMGEKAEETANKIDRQARSRKIATA